MKVKVNLAVNEDTGEIITEQEISSINTEREYLRKRFKKEAEKFFYNSATYSSDFLTTKGMNYINDDLEEFIGNRVREIFENNITKEELVESFMEIVMERFDDSPTDYIGDVYPHYNICGFETYIIEITEEDIVG